MSNPDYFLNFSPKSFSDEYLEKEDEQIEKDLFKSKNLRREVILD